MPDGTSGEPNEVSRRGFVGWAVGLGAGFIGVVAGIPLIGSVVIPTAQAQAGEFVQVADVSVIPVGEPFAISFAETKKDAYQVVTLPHSVYVLKTSATEVVVYSPVCPHLGCQVFFDRQVREYICPCHGSKFALDGARLAGPTPRGLDTLPSKIEKGALWVQWVQYKPGIPEKVPV